MEVNNGVSLGLAEQWIEEVKPTEIETTKGNLYVLAVGVNAFDKIAGADKNVIPDLSFADNDAAKLAELLRKLEESSAFNQVKVHLLADSADSKPNRQAILEALKIFEQAEPNDTVVLFLASHGFSDKKGNYYFLPKDGSYTDIEAVMSGRNLSGKSPSLLSWTDFIDSMRKAAGRAS